MAPAPPSFVLRQAGPQDHRQLLRLARVLDSTSLPTDSAELADTLERSAKSFAGKIARREQAVYVFCAEEVRLHRVVAASMIIGKHGTPTSPHYFFEMDADERYSHTLRRKFRHTYLRLRHSMDGPSEIGGLIVSPAMRGHPQRIGKQISWVRFLFIASHRACFERQLIAEMLPPSEPGHRNRFWDHYGRLVTGLSYRDADRVSMHDKEFIHALFPDAPLYTFMLPEEVRNTLGAVGENTHAAVKFLEQAGMRFLNQIDPFDGGPYYGAEIDDLAPVKFYATYRATAGVFAEDEARNYLIAREDARVYRAVAAAAVVRNRRMIISHRNLDTLGAKEGDRLATVPIP